jgi:DNA-directed RNA polymerase subunit RPC12/RpoP
MKKNHKYFVIRCNQCRSDIKVDPNTYREKKKVTCDNCLDKIFKKFKRH